MSRMLEALGKWWEAERAHHFLWLPVAFAGGMAGYFGLHGEPARWVLPALSLLCVGLCIVLWRRARPVMLALLLVVLGACWAQISTWGHPPVVLTESLTPRPILGVVRDVERVERGVRLTLDRVTIRDLPTEKTPDRVRISIRLKQGDATPLPAIGDAITIMAGMMAPMGPSLPHGFDFARFFYFRDIGAVGYGLPPWNIVAEDNAPTLANQFRNWRIRLTERILDTLGPETGGVGAGLITGDARTISEADFNALKASNLYHIIAISGEHMMVIAGVIFISLRLLALALPKRIGLRPEMKSIAAAITLLLVTAYLFVTGLPISAVRAYGMIFLVLLAVLMRRQVHALRSLAITAWVMLVYDPSNLLEPGFQLSFAATLAILTLVEWALLRPAIGMAPRWQRVLRAGVTMLMVSVVAELATAPIAIAHFNNFSLYGILANMVATPLVSLFLMPTVALFFLLLPLGLEGWALQLMDMGIRALLGLAHTIASWPHAQMFAPSLPGWGLCLFGFGLLWLCLWQTRVRRYGVVLMVLGVATLGLTRAPDMLVSGNLKHIVLRQGEDYVLARGRSNSLLPELWANGLGYKQLPQADMPGWRCDRLGCVATLNGTRIAFPFDGAALLEDCGRAQLVLTPVEGLKCSAPLLSGPDLARPNVTAFWFEEGQVRTETSADWQGNRPWSAHAVEEGEE